MNVKIHKLPKFMQQGFTLLELVFGIVVMSTVLLIMTGALFPQAERSTDPWFQVRSAELAQSMMNEILARRFDENSLVIGNLRCGEIGAGDCATETELTDCDTTEEGTEREFYDDVDDFNCLDLTGNDITDIEGNELTNVYKQFQVTVTVNYDATYTDAKLITVTVTPPHGADVIYSSLKANY